MGRELIRYLKKQSDFVPVNLLAEELDLHRDAVFTQVEDLIDGGYSIEFHPYLGVKLIDIPAASAVRSEVLRAHGRSFVLKCSELPCVLRPESR